jgi:fatty acid desaturase
MCRPTTLQKKGDQPEPVALDDASDASSTETTLQQGDEWLEKFDFDSFRTEIALLGKKLEAEQGPADVAHLSKMVMWSNMCAAIGLLTMGFGINPISIIAISTFTFSRWTMIAHHTCHGGYDKCHPNKGRWSRFKFGLGSLWRRFCDWFDWMMPEAWNVEHNNRHHYNLSEVTDPDLVEMNLEQLRDAPIPVFFKYFVVFGAMVTWKWFYYAPNTYKELKLAKWRREGRAIPDDVKPEDAVTFKTFLLGGTPFYSVWEFISVVVGPYFLIHFFLFPLPYMLVGQYLGDYGYDGQTMYWTAVKNLFYADLLTNAHGFLAVVTNHAGDDMYRFRKACRPFSGSFYLRQVLASTDYSMGSDFVDFLHGWLNYQIEHHMWPNLSMLSYQKSAPFVQEICDRHGVPYVKQNVFLRLKKTVDIMVGSTSMKWLPEAYETKYLEQDALIENEKKKTK